MLLWFLFGDPDLSPWAEMLLLALAAPVLAVSNIFLKKPCFLVFGVDKPPKIAL